jgi:hypothetical protein
LAESVQLSGGDVLLILGALLLVAALWAGTVVGGFILAPRAGRGSRRAMGWFVAVLILEGLQCLGSVSWLLRGQVSLWSILPLAIVGGQLALYFQARRAAGR